MRLVARYESFGFHQHLHARRQHATVFPSDQSACERAEHRCGEAKRRHDRSRRSTKDPLPTGHLHLLASGQLFLVGNAFDRFQIVNTGASCGGEVRHGRASARGRRAWRGSRSSLVRQTRRTRPVRTGAGSPGIGLFGCLHELGPGLSLHSARRVSRCSEWMSLFNNAPPPSSGHLPAGTGAG